MIRNQEAKKVRDIGSLIFETPIQHDYEEGVEVRSLLSSEQLEEVDGRMAIVDTSPRLVRVRCDFGWMNLLCMKTVSVKPELQCQLSREV